MKSTTEALKDLFLTGDSITGNELTQFFDQVHVPDETGWRALFRFVFDPPPGFGPSPEEAFSRGALRPVVQKALEIIDASDYSEASVHALIKEFNSICVGLSQRKFKEALFEIAILTDALKSTCLTHQTGLKNLEQRTLENVLSIDGDPEEVVERIKRDFQILGKAFQTDMAKLDSISHTDYLTGLNNRRFFDKQLAVETNEARSSKNPLNLIMIDIDDFKKFNDAYGHVVGDQALKAVALKIRTVSDTFAGQWGGVFYSARYGGEEFCVILPGIDLTRANEMATAIKDTIGSYHFVIRDAQGVISDRNICLTVSIGLSQFKNSRETAGIEELVTDADKAMYAAKKAGKNCVRISR
ncbi:MAG: GGDEF domain-containing protein [Pseudomonadota bacterium]